MMFLESKRFWNFVAALVIVLVTRDLLVQHVQDATRISQLTEYAHSLQRMNVEMNRKLRVRQPLSAPVFSRGVIMRHPHQGQVIRTWTNTATVSRSGRPVHTWTNSVLFCPPHHAPR